MPSPIGHGLGALAAGWLLSRPAPPGKARWRQVAILTAVGIAPDLDLLWGRHSMETHSLGAAVAIATLAAWQRWPVASARLVIWVTVAAAWMTHPLLDSLSADTSVPIGVQALWPLSHGFFTTGWDYFGPISRRYWLDNFWRINLASLGRELLTLLPLVATVWFLRRRS